MDPAVLQSLQEIASLLLLVHDYYLKDVYGNDILVSLTVLIRDVGLSGIVSLLDIERLRRLIMEQSNHDMGYELFYDWLRAVGQLVFNDNDTTGKKALHYLLTRYVIPFASKIELNTEESRHAYGANMPFYSDGTLQVMVEYGDFILLWYIEILNIVSVHHILQCLLRGYVIFIKKYTTIMFYSQRFPSPSLNGRLWAHITSAPASRGGCVSSLQVLGSLTRYSIVPDLMGEDQLESLLTLASTTTAASSAAAASASVSSSSTVADAATVAGSSHVSEELALPGFLHVLELIEEAVPDYRLPYRAARRGDYDDDGSNFTDSKLVRLMQVLACNMFRRKTFQFMMRWQHNNRDGGAMEADDIGTVQVFDEDALQSGCLSDEDILWWLRQAGALLDTPHTQIPAVLQCLDACAASESHQQFLFTANSTEASCAIQAGDVGSSHRWRAATIEFVLAAVVAHLDGDADLFQRYGNDSDAAGEHQQQGATLLLQLARRLPALFFADPSTMREHVDPHHSRRQLGQLATKDDAAAVAEALRCLYCAHTSMPLRDAALEVQAALTQLWGAISTTAAAGGHNNNGENMINADHHLVSLQAVLVLCGHRMIVPNVISSEALIDICSALSGSSTSTSTSSASDDSEVVGCRLSQAHVFEVFYVVTYLHWQAVESLRRPRVGGSGSTGSGSSSSGGGVRLSQRQPQRAQQVLQAFLFLLTHQQGQVQPPNASIHFVETSATTTTTAAMTTKGPSESATSPQEQAQLAKGFSTQTIPVGRPKPSASPADKHKRQSRTSQPDTLMHQKSPTTTVT